MAIAAPSRPICRGKTKRQSSRLVRPAAVQWTALAQAWRAAAPCPGEAWRAVEPHHEHGCGAKHIEWHEQGYPPEIGAGKRHQAVGAAEEAAHPLLCREHHGREHDARHQAGQYALSDVQVGGVAVVMREVDACHHAATDAQHQSHATAQQEEGRHYVDCCQRVTAHSMPY